MLIALASIGTAAPVFAQTSDGDVDLGAHVSVLHLSEFDVTDTGRRDQRSMAVIAVRAASRIRVCFEMGDLMVRYGKEAHRTSGELSDGFISHNMQVSSGVMWRF